MSKNTDESLQTKILKQNIGKKVTFGMDDGQIFEATIYDFDRFSILVKKKSARKYTMLFKHSISYMEDVAHSPRGKDAVETESAE